MPLGRALGKAIIRSLVGQDLPADKIVDIARKAGGGYHYQTMLKDIRIEEGRALHHRQIRDLPRNNLVPREWIVEREFTRPAKYRVLGEMTVYDYETGEATPRLASFFTDDYAKLEHYDADFMTRAGEYQYDDKTEILGFKATGLEHNSRLGY